MKFRHTDDATLQRYAGIFDPNCEDSKLVRAELARRAAASVAGSPEPPVPATPTAEKLAAPIAEFTIAVAADTKRATKLHRANGRIEDYDAGTFFGFATKQIRNVAELQDFLHSTSAFSTWFIVRGAVNPAATDNRGKGFTRRLNDKGDGLTAGLIDALLAWLMIDDDKHVYSARPTAEQIRANLPEALREASFVVQASASSRPGKWKLHLWFLLDRLVSDEELRTWFKGEPAIDCKVFNPVQPHFIANPLFEDGRPDPLAGQRIWMVEGALERVAVPIIEVKPKRKVKSEGKDARADEKDSRTRRKAPSALCKLPSDTDMHMTAWAERMLANRKTEITRMHDTGETGTADFALTTGLMLAPVVVAGLLDGAAVVEAMSVSLHAKRSAERGLYELEVLEGNVAVAELANFQAAQRSGHAAAAKGGSGRTGQTTQGALDVPPMPAMESCPVVARLIKAADDNALDVNVTLCVFLGTAANLIGERFDVVVFGSKKGISFLAIGLARTGEGKSRILDALTKPAIGILRSRMARAAESYEPFRRRLHAYRTANPDAPIVEPLILRRIAPANATPQILSVLMTMGAPPALCTSDEISKLFTVAEGNNFFALLDLIIAMADHTVDERLRMGDGKQNGETLFAVLSDVRSGDANSATRMSIVGLTQPETWTKTILGEGRLKVMESRGALARLLVFPPTGKADPTAYSGNAAVAFAEAAALLETLGMSCTMFVECRSRYRALQPTLRPVSVRLRGKPDTVIAAPTVPRGVMLSGDARVAPAFRLREDSEKEMLARRNELLRQIEAGMLGTGREVLRGIVTRLVDKAAQIAATLHGVNLAAAAEGAAFLAREFEGAVTEPPMSFLPFGMTAHAPFTTDKEDAKDPFLEIPHAVAMDAWDLVTRVTFAALNGGYYGLGALGRVSNAAAKIAAADAPTAESEAIASAAETRAILLRKLHDAGSDGVTARDLFRKLSKPQGARFGGQVAEVQKGLLALCTEALATADADGRTFRARYAAAAE